MMMVTAKLLIAVYSGLSGDPFVSDTLCSESGSIRQNSRAYFLNYDSLESFVNSEQNDKSTCDITGETRIASDCMQTPPRLHKEIDRMRVKLDSLIFMAGACLKYCNKRKAKFKIDREWPLQLSFDAEDRFGNGLSVFLDYDRILRFKIWNKYANAMPAPLKYEHMEVRLDDSLYNSILSLIDSFGIGDLPIYRITYRSNELSNRYRGHSRIVIKQRFNGATFDDLGFFPNDLQGFENALETLLLKMPYEVIRNSNYIYTQCIYGRLPAQLCYDDSDPYIRWMKNKNLIIY